VVFQLGDQVEHRQGNIRVQPNGRRDLTIWQSVKAKREVQLPRRILPVAAMGLNSTTCLGGQDLLASPEWQPQTALFVRHSGGIFGVRLHGTEDFGPRGRIQSVQGESLQRDPQMPFIFDMAKLLLWRGQLGLPLLNCVQLLPQLCQLPVSMPEILLCLL